MTTFSSKVPVHHTSLFTIIGEFNHGVVTSAGGNFDTSSYSRFKYGDTYVADRYGQLLAGLILGCQVFRTAKFNPEHVVLTASAYKGLPTAAQAVVDSAARTLHSYGYPINGGGRVYRSNLIEGDYGTMSASERSYWMEHNGLRVDAQKFIGRDVVVIDDVKITGAHGDSIVRMFQDIDVRSVTLVNVVELSAGLAEQDPTIENRMNHAAVKTLADLARLIGERPCWAANARAVKFILSHPVHEAMSLVRQLPLPLVRYILDGIEQDGYDTMDTYHTVARQIQKHVIESTPVQTTRRLAYA